MNADAAQLLSYLGSLPSRPEKRVLVGQHIRGSSIVQRYPTHITSVFDETGKYPAMLGIDFYLEPHHSSTWPQARDLLIEYWNQGGLISVDWSMLKSNNPFQGGPVDMTKLIDPSTPEHARWMVKLREKAGWLRELQNAGMVIIFRPFIELNGGPHNNWWKGQPYPQTISAWRFMHDLYTNEYDLDGVLWMIGYVASGGSADKLGYYPGPDYVDITALSVYNDGTPANELNDRGMQELLNLGHPFGFIEYGSHVSGKPAPESFDTSMVMRDIPEHAPQVAFVKFWDTTRRIAAWDKVAELMNHPLAITRPVDWRADPPPPPPPMGPDWAYLSAHHRAISLNHQAIADHYAQFTAGG